MSVATDLEQFEAISDVEWALRMLKVSKEAVNVPELLRSVLAVLQAVKRAMPCTEP